MSLTRFDLYNARLYALQHFIKMKYDTYRVSHPHLFRHVTVNERPATNNDYYIPKSIIDKCVIYDIKFDPVGCRKTSCFPFKEEAKHCTPSDSTHNVRIGDQYLLACQPACFHLGSGETHIMDTYYENGKCLLFNYLTKQFALNPQPELHNLSLSLDGENLIHNDYYCHAYGLVYGDDHYCEETTHQVVLESLVGSTIYRSIHSNLQPPMPRKLIRPPSIPTDISTLSDWKSDVVTKRDVKRPAGREQQNSWSRDIVVNIAKEMAIDYAVDVTGSQIARVLTKTVPKILVGRVSVGTLAAIVRYKITAKAITALTLKAAGKAVSVSLSLINILGLVTIPLDLLDVGGFNEVLTENQLKEFSTELESQFRRMNNGDDRELLPQDIFPLLDDDMEDEAAILFLEEKIVEYLSALDVNSYGQRLAIQEKIMRPKPKEIDQPIYLFFITTLFMILSIVFYQQLKYVVVGFLGFIIFYNHSIFFTKEN